MILQVTGLVVTTVVTFTFSHFPRSPSPPLQALSLASLLLRTAASIFVIQLNFLLHSASSCTTTPPRCQNIKLISIMAPTVPVNHDPALSHTPANAVPQQAPQQPQGMTQPLLPADIANLQVNTLDPQQIMNLLRSLPNVFNKLTEQGNLKEDAAQTLSNLSQAPFQAGAPHPGAHPYPGQPQAAGGLPGINDPGPSSHPRGPPNLGQLSAVAMSSQPVAGRPGQLPGQPQEVEEASEDDRRAASQASGSAEVKTAASPGTSPSATAATTTRARGGRSATMGSDEWTRQRKDNHKEVERRRRGNINEGINELGRIVPNGSGEKAKGAILARAVQYIHHLKENEARNIEKWTLEKLLMDQAMGDLQTQLEEMKKMWEEERMAKLRAENELEVLRGAMAASQQNQQAQAVHARVDSQSLKRDAETAGATSESDKEGKKQRAE
ncbi:putative helix loop helix domain containing protein [Lyophyllum shimeji]|uniref:Helix loop helix domain containing protein n=1 Tax=Lyophyllum shimeji TaxID=47721 RepID=A0A9P3PWB1_LYOSH|nr:putative helix loop helix domain containing protein [Lyophyllum shimeji]